MALREREGVVVVVPIDSLAVHTACRGCVRLCFVKQQQCTEEMFGVHKAVLHCVSVLCAGNSPSTS
jgi:hypothetical protein